MPGTIRPNKKAMKIAYRILNTPKSLQQKNQPNPTERLIKQWFIDSSMAQ